MPVILLLVLFYCVPANVCAQGKLTGFVVDDEFNEPIEKAVITIPGTLISVLTDQQGKYELKMIAGDYFMEINCPGYYGRKYNMSVSDGITTPMFIVKLKSIRVGEDLQRRITSRENKTELPLSIENFSLWQIAEQNGHQEFNEMLKTIPAVSLLNNGSGFNDTEVGFRGNDASHTSYTFNGILLNNPETGKMSSSMLSGLTDWMGNLQVSEGQAAGMQSQIKCGGLVNVQSFSPHEESGVELQAIYGNAGFLKTSATIHSGLSKKGLASSFQVSRTSGDGLVQNTGFEQYSYFIQFQKELNHRHTLVLGLNGTIQEHDRNFADSIGVYNLYGTTYNRFWGKLGSKPVSWSTEYARSPLFSLTHFWHSRIKTQVSTQIYAQFNRSAQLYPDGKMISQPIDSIPRDDTGNILFDRIYSWNSGENVEGMGISRLPDTSGKFMNSFGSGISTLARIDRETRFGLRSVISHQINKKLEASAALDLQSYVADHFGAVHNLLGADGYVSYSDVNRAGGFSVSNLFKSGLFPDFLSGEKTGRNYQTGIQTAGFSAQMNYAGKGYFWFAEGAASLQEMKRTDHFNYLETDPAQKSESLLLPGAHAQTGLRFDLWNYHSIHLRIGYGSYQPLFATIFPFGNNLKNQEAKNEQVFDAEFGYTIYSRRLKIEALAYHSAISNRSMVRHIIQEGENLAGLINGMAELKQGVELKASYKLTKNFQLNVNGAVGDWKYSKDAIAEVYDPSNELVSEYELWLKSTRIANSPQISLFAEAEYRWAHNFYIRLNYYRAEQLYAPFGLTDFKDLVSRSDYEQWKLPKYDLIGVSGNYLLKIRKFGEINLIFGGNNLLDTEYIEQTATNMNEENPRYTGNQVFYGSGRTWFAGLKFNF